MTPAKSDQNTRVKAFTTAALFGGLILSVGAMSSPERVWSNLLIGTFFLVSLGLGGALFIALTTICGATWNRGFRRLPEALASTLPLSALVLFAVLLMHMVDWSPHEGDPGTFWFKQWWTNSTFWAGRTAAYLAVWVLLSRALLASSNQRNTDENAQPSPYSLPLSALFLVVYAVTFSLASCDWFMLLDPLWFSTIWGVYHFAGMFQATLAVMIVVGLALRSRGGPLRGEFTDDHLHDLGKLLLGFSCFWMYIWFCQYMLIWYTNIPEETSYFILRARGPWGPILIVSIVLNWVVPFFVLLPRPCKRSGSVMMKVAVVVLIGRWVDLYTIVFPKTIGGVPKFGLWETAAVICLIGCFGVLILRLITGASRQSSGDRAPTSDPQHDHAGALPNG